MGAYKYIRNTFINEYKVRSDEYKNRLAKWGKENSIIRVDKPTNLPRARVLGYKAKQGLIVVRVKVKKGRKKRAMVGGGRKPSKNGRFFSRATSMQSIAEVRATKKYSNCEVLNSYYVGDTGPYKFYEVLLVDSSHPAITKDPILKDVAKQRGRAERSLTSSGKRHRVKS